MPGARIWNKRHESILASQWTKLWWPNRPTWNSLKHIIAAKDDESVELSHHGHNPYWDTVTCFAGHEKRWGDQSLTGILEKLQPSIKLPVASGSFRTQRLLPLLPTWYCLHVCLCSGARFSWDEGLPSLTLWLLRLLMLLLTEALDLWGQQHPMANIGRSIATASRKSAPQISLWAHGANAWLGRLCTSTRISGKTIPSTWSLPNQSVRLRCFPSLFDGS